MGNEKMIKAAKRILSKIRGTITNGEDDQTSPMTSVPGEPPESSNPAPPPEAPPAEPIGINPNPL